MVPHLSISTFLSSATALASLFLQLFATHGRKARNSGSMSTTDERFSFRRPRKLLDTMIQESSLLMDERREERISTPAVLCKKHNKIAGFLFLKNLSGQKLLSRRPPFGTNPAIAGNGVYLYGLALAPRVLHLVGVRAEVYTEFTLSVTNVFEMTFFEITLRNGIHAKTLIKNNYCV